MKKILNIAPLGFPWKTKDPFIFCAYHRDEYPEGTSEMGMPSNYKAGRPMGQDFNPNQPFRMYHGASMPGFPYHPHRGFETVTINLEGAVDHTDSLGAAGRFMDGDVQWMTAGKGLQHSEMFPLIHKDKPNPLEIFQIWLNLPARSKLVPPHFKMLWKEDIPQIIEKDTSGNEYKIKIVAGALNGVRALDPTPDSWAANPDHAVGIFTAELAPGAQFTMPATNTNASRALYFYKGDRINIDDQQMHSGHYAEAMAGEDLLLENNGSATAFLLILEGVPIGEPVVQHGPFVMNTPEEIREAMREYGKTEFGGWPWPKKEVAHPRDKGRFALYSDGSEEIPGNKN